MQKQAGSIMLVAGTAIGSGMIALPMLIAKIGIIPGIFLMLVNWWIVYHTALVNVELNLQAGEGSTLGNLGRKFSGKVAEVIGTGSFKILSYSLLSAYVYGGSSVLQKLLQHSFNQEFEFFPIATIYAFISILLLIMPLKLMSYVNKILFISLITIVAVLVIGLLATINPSNLPLFSDNYKEISIWHEVIPVMFTSFGFQVIFHTLTNFCDKDAKVLKKVFFWGSLIPAIIYIIWVSSILGAIYQENNSFFQEMIAGKVEIGDLVKELSNISRWPFIQTLVWWLSLLAVVTSVLGVGLGLCDSIKEMFPTKLNNNILSNVLAATITIMPAYVIAILVPNAFISVLGFAGMILVVIAILLPIYLLLQIQTKNFYYPELKNKYMIYFSFVMGLIIIGCEIFNMF
ncbi:MAG: aromatic amino acid transport family protein [Rickettsiales bacterium]